MPNLKSNASRIFKNCNRKILKTMTPNEKDRKMAPEEKLNFAMTNDEAEALNQLIFAELKMGQKAHRAATLEDFKILAAKKNYQWFTQLFKLTDKLNRVLG